MDLKHADTSGGYTDLKHDSDRHIDAKVTIGICVKNAEPTIKEAIESVVKQDYPHDMMELIVVDGQSQDRTLSILKNIIEDASMSTKIFCEGKGLGLARQIVVDNTQGRYIVWVDGDMVLTKDFVRTQVLFMEGNPTAGIAKGRYGALSWNSNSLVGNLENVGFMLDTMNEGETDLMALGTSGCIYRVEAIRQAGGFDTSIWGVGEDMDAENRIRKAGWLIKVSPALFYEKRRQTLVSLWREYYWHGKGGRQILKKNARVIDYHKMFPPFALASEIMRVPSAYRLTHRKGVLLLPFHYGFKRLAWLSGFMRGMLEAE